MSDQFGEIVRRHVVEEPHVDTPVSVYDPIPQNAAVYARLYPLYRKLHDAFGNTGQTGSLANVMKDLIALRNEVRKGK